MDERCVHYIQSIGLILSWLWVFDALGMLLGYFWDVLGSVGLLKRLGCSKMAGFYRRWCLYISQMNGGY